MNMMIRGSVNSITSTFPFPLKEALLPGLSASPAFPPACVPCSPPPNILISGRKNGTGSILASRPLPAAIPISRDIFKQNNTSSTAGNSFAGNSVYSLAAQTLRDLEIICVDDGSTDGSGGIVRKYASGDSRFRLITQENSGRAEARNAGIRAAAAPYLGFADPDDYVEPDMYERLYRLAEETGADMVQCSYSPFLPAESEESRGMAEEKLLHIENTACDGVFTEKGEIFRLFLEDRITGVVWSKLFRRLLPGCSAPLEVRLPSSFTSGEDTLYVSRAIARCRSVALTSEKLYHYGLGGPQSVSSRNRKAETRPASYYAVFEMLTREKLREGVLGSNRTAYMNYIVPLLFPDNEMPAGRLRHWAELWREADITSEHVCGMPREQRAYLEAALAGRWIYLRLLQCFWKFKTARRKMFRLRFSKNGIDTLQILGYTLYSAKKLPRSSL